MNARSLLDFVPIVSMIVPTVITFVVIAVVAFALKRAVRSGGKSLPGLLGQVGRAMAAGVASPQQLAVERNGRIAEATVLDRNDLDTVAKNRFSVYHLGALVLEVRIPGEQPYRAPCQQWFASSQWSDVMADSVVPVRVDPGNPQIVFVDLAACAQGKQDAESAEREAHARRQAELLSSNKR